MTVNWLDEGMVERIRGVTYSTRVSSQFENTMIHAACGIFNCLLPDVHIFTDHKAGPQAGKSPGYGISLVAETTSSCFISSDTAVSYALGEAGEIDNDEKEELMPPENVWEEIASFLLEDIQKGGVVDSTHQGLLFLLCALCEPDVSKVRVGKLLPYGVEIFLVLHLTLGQIHQQGQLYLDVWDADIRTLLQMFHDYFTQQMLLAVESFFQRP